jgi:hypothetical protein
MKEFFKQQKGAITVEFILLVPFMMMLLLMMLDFGSFLLRKQGLSSTTRSIITIVSNTPNFAIDHPALLSMAQTSLGPDATNLVLNVSTKCTCNTVPTSCTTNCGAAPSRMEVNADISYDHTLIFPYPGIGQTVRVSDSLAFRLR